MSDRSGNATAPLVSCWRHPRMRPLLDRIRGGDIDPTVVISHHLWLDQAPHGYEILKQGMAAPK